MKRASHPLLVALACLATTGLAACGGEEGEHHGAGHDKNPAKMGRHPLPPPAEPTLDVAALRTEALKHFGALPASFETPENPLTPAKIDLGRMLYYDGRLSKTGEVSCNSCHDLAKFGVDGEPTSPGHDGRRGDRNANTVYNAAGHLAQFWDGRAATVEEQAKGPILNPIEMGHPDEQTCVDVVAGIPGYVEAFAAAFPDEEQPLSYDNIANAIGAFERKLSTPGPFDAWINGDDEALSADAAAGLALYLESNCQSCHASYLFGGMSYQKLGTEKPWPGLEDVGRFAVTNDERDRFVFKVPSLRNIAKTGPYLHDGSIADLETMIAKMVEHQTKRAPYNPDEMRQMLAFMDALTGELPMDYIAKPELPAGPAAGEPDAGVVGADGGDEAAEEGVPGTGPTPEERREMEREGQEDDLSPTEQPAKPGTKAPG